MQATRPEIEHKPVPIQLVLVAVFLMLLPASVWGADGNTAVTAEKRVAPAGEDVGQKPTEVLHQIHERMQHVETLLAQGDVSTRTQRTQQQIVESLEVLIERLQQQQKKQCSTNESSCKGGDKNASGSGAPKKGRKAARKAARPAGQTGVATGGSSDAVQRVVGRLWGQLPEHVRQQMQGMRQIRFLPQYRRLIEDYYRRLAEQPRLAP